MNIQQGLKKSALVGSSAGQGTGESAGHAITAGSDYVTARESCAGAGRP